MRSCRTKLGSGPAAYRRPQVRATTFTAVADGFVWKAPPCLPILENHKEIGKLSGSCLGTKPCGSGAPLHLSTEIPQCGVGNIMSSASCRTGRRAGGSEGQMISELTSPEKGVGSANSLYHLAGLSL